MLKRYAWGSLEALPALLGREPDGEPWAELWFGTHSGGPATVVRDGPALVRSSRSPGSCRTWPSSSPPDRRCRCRSIRRRHRRSPGSNANRRPGSSRRAAADLPGSGGQAGGVDRGQPVRCVVRVPTDRRNGRGTAHHRGRTARRSARGRRSGSRRHLAARHPPAAAPDAPAVRPTRLDLSGRSGRAGGTAAQPDRAPAG